MESINYKGCVSWSKVNCSSPKNFYGSEVKSDAPIELTISRSEDEWHLSKQRFHRESDIIKIEMTPIQWAEFLTSGQCNSGVPCTITYVDGQHLERPSKDGFEQVINNFEMDAKKEFDEFTSLFNKFADELQEQVDKNSLSKKEIKEIISKMRIKASHPEAINFIKKSFNETMTSVVAKAKAEITAFMEQKIYETGLKALQNESSNVAVAKNEEHLLSAN